MKEGLVELVEAVYDCALDAALWPDMLDRLRQAIACHNAALTVHALPTGAILQNVTRNIEPLWAERMVGYAADMYALFGGFERFMTFPVYEPHVASQAADRATLEANRYVREWARPQGIGDAVGLFVAKERDYMGSIAFGRHIDDGAFSEPDLDLLRALGPHIRRAVSINRLLDYHAIRAATFEAVLESVGSVVVLVDRALRVIHVNRAGREALEMRAPLFVRQGVLQLADRRAAMRLAEAVEAVEQRAGGLEQRIAIPLRTTGGEAFVIHVLPIQPRQLGTLVPPSAVAALFLASAASPAPPPIAAFAELYDLTPAEARIAELIAEGLAPAEIAGRIGAAPATVRTHLLRVFQKSGVSRQGDLAVRIRAFAGPASTA